MGRTGVIHTTHGDIQTPAFVPVATKASVKSVTPDQLKEIGVQVVLGNTYHLYLQPGDEIVRDAGGMGKFMHWDGPTITDSGGFQVFSLGAAYGKEISKVVKITDPSFLIPERFDDSDAPRLAKVGNDGVSFKSHLDGSMHYITAEKSIEIQHNLGADIIFAFDECTSPAEDLRYQKEALDRTHAWATRCLVKHLELKSKKEKVKGGNQNTPALFGIVQGGRNEKLRKESAKVISEMKTENGESYDGFGIGGSFAKEDMNTAVEWVNQILPEDKPRHLLGIGEPEDILMGVENGVDLFDCVAPTRNARNGTLYTREGKINITNTKYQSDFGPIEKGCHCYVCENQVTQVGPGQIKSKSRSDLDNGLGKVKFSRAYIAHLFRGKEMLAATLATVHNLAFMERLMSDIRKAINDGSYDKFKKEFLKKYTK